MTTIMITTITTTIMITIMTTTTIMTTITTMAITAMSGKAVIAAEPHQEVTRA